MKSASPPLLPLLRSEAQGRLLAEILLHPAEEHSITDLAHRANAPLATVVREVNRFEDAGIAVSRAVGRSRMVRADNGGAIARPLTELVALTFGPPVVLADELAEVPAIQEVFLHGSWAARLAGRRGPAPQDVDVLVVGTPNRSDLDAAADRAERRLGMRVDIRIRSPEQWAAAEDLFVLQLRSKPLYRLDLRMREP